MIRPYRSKRSRPCDLCRQRKACCTGPPCCSLCKANGRECTFVQGSSKRSRPVRQDSMSDGKGRSYPEMSPPIHRAARGNGNNGTSKKDDMISNDNESVSTESPRQIRTTPSNTSTPMDEAQGQTYPPTFSHPSLANHRNFQQQLQRHDGGQNGLTNGYVGDFDPAAEARLLRSPSSRRSTRATSTALSEIDWSLFETDNPLFQFPAWNAQSPALFDPVNANTPSVLREMQQQIDEQAASRGDGSMSLDDRAGYNCQLFGWSAESDPYLLKHYQFDANEEFKFIRLTFRKIANQEVPIMFVQSMNSLGQSSINELLDVGFPTPNLDYDLLHRIISPSVGRRLIRLFFEHVYPAFPVLSRERTFDPLNMSTALLAAIYGIALEFRMYDEQLCVDVYSPPNPADLFRISWRQICRDLHTPKLATLQACLLLLQRKTPNPVAADTPFTGGLLGMCVKLSQTLGLHLDPSTWHIPEWEKRIRRRLWWVVYVQDVWVALSSGTPMTLHADDFDVAPLTTADYLPSDEYPFDERSNEHFIHLMTLSTIVAKILHSFYSVHAVRRHAKDLQSTLDLGRSFRIALHDWKSNLPQHLGMPIDEPGQLQGNGTLHLCYIVADITLFRALLRPIVKPDSRCTPQLAEAAFTCRTGARSCAKLATDFALSLRSEHIQSFWHTCKFLLDIANFNILGSRSSFAIISNFFMLLLITALTNAEARECKLAIDSWRRVLRTQARSFDIMSLGVLRCDAVFFVGVDRLIYLSPETRSALKDQTGMLHGSRP